MVEKSRVMSLFRSGADVWYTELSVPERGVEYRYLIVQSLWAGESVGLRVISRETFIEPRRLALSQCNSLTEGELVLQPSQ